MVKKISLKLKINKSDNLFAGIFLIFFFIGKTLPMPDIIANFSIASAGLLCFVWLIIRKINILKWIFVASVASVLMLFSILVNSNPSYYEPIWTWSFLGAAILLIKGKVSSSLIEKIYFVVMAFFSFNIINGVEPQNALSSGSGNNVATYVLFYVILIYIKRYEEGKKIIIWPCITAVLFALWGNGRGGLLASIILAFLIIFYRFICERKGKFRTFIIIVILMLLGRYILYHYMGEFIDEFIYKMNRYGTSSIRVKIWKEYLEQITGNIIYFIFGAPTTEGHWAALYNGNLHNAFLMAHANYGIVGFVYIVFSTMMMMYRFLKEKNNYLWIFVIVWFVRSMFDWTGFPGIFDVLFWSFIIRSKETVYFPENTYL